MLREERQEEILRELALSGALRAKEYAARVGASGMTIRRDLEELEARGLLRRVHGGAIASVSHGASGAASGLAIGMVAPSASYYYPDIIRGAREAAADTHRLALAISEYHDDRELRQVRQLLSRGVAALIVTPAVDLRAASPLAAILAAAPVSVVVAERTVEPVRLLRGISTVRTDHESGADLAVEHLTALGHSRIALAVRERTATGPQLLAGFVDSSERHGVAARTVQLPRDDGSRVAPVAVAAFLDEIVESRTTAVVVLTDVDAIALEELALERGMRIPDDLAIVAYDDEVAGIAPVPLTAVAPPKHEIGRMAFDLCVRQRDDAAVAHVTLLPSLIVRESTGAA